MTAREPRRPRVVLVFDRADWVLGTLAVAVREILEDGISASVSMLRVPDIYTEPRVALSMLRHADVVHWLSQYGYLRFRGLAPSAVHVCTIHHVVEDDPLRPEPFRDALVVTDSESGAADLEARGFDRPHVLGLAVDAGVFTPRDRSAARQALGLEPSGPLVGWFAKGSSDVSSRKGSDLLAHVMRSLSQTHGAELLLTGEGWDGLVEELVRSGVVVHFRPADDVTQMPDRYAALDVFLCTSRLEGGPVTVMEAMASARAVASTPVGMVPEVVVDGQNGVLLPLQGLEEWPSLLSGVLHESTDRAAMEAAARARILEGWTWEARRPAIVELYQGALTRRPRRSLRPIVEGVGRLAIGVARRRLRHRR